MRLRRCALGAAGFLVLALPLTVWAQDLGNLRAAGVAMSATALELQAATQRTLAGTSAGDVLIRDLQTFRTQVDAFRAALDLGRSPEDVGRRFARLASTYRCVQRDLQNLPP